MTLNVIATNEGIAFTVLNEFDEIPKNPEKSDLWMVTHNIALWYSGTNNEWRLMLLEYDELARLSGEAFETKQQAKEFFDAKKIPTWVKLNHV